MDSEVQNAAQRLLEKCTRAGLTVCAAESCTGGLVASSIVSVPHASGFFLGSSVVYCDAAKENVLGVRRETVEKYFAESPQCADEMAECAARAFRADIAVSATGFLDSNVGGKPAALAGRVFISLFLRGGFDRLALSLDVSRGRAENRKAAALSALNLILSKLDKIS